MFIDIHILWQLSSIKHFFYWFPNYLDKNFCVISCICLQTMRKIPLKNWKSVRDSNFQLMKARAKICNSSAKVKVLLKFFKLLEVRLIPYYLCFIIWPLFIFWCLVWYSDVFNESRNAKCALYNTTFTNNSFIIKIVPLHFLLTLIFLSINWLTFIYLWNLIYFTLREADNKNSDRKLYN